METLEESAEEVAAPIAGKRHAQSVDGRPGGGGVLGHVQIGTHPCLITKHEGSVAAVWPRAPLRDSAAMWSPGARWSRWWSRQHTAHCLRLASRSPCESLGTLVMFRRTVHDTLHALCGGCVVSPGALWSRWWLRQGTAQCLSMASRSPCESLGTLVMSRWTVHDSLHAPVRWVCRQSRCSVVAMWLRQGTAQCVHMASQST